jgi:hypothetical protein
LFCHQGRPASSDLPISVAAVLAVLPSGAPRVLHPLGGAQSPPSVKQPLGDAQSPPLVKQPLGGVKIGEEAARARHVVEGTEGVVSQSCVRVDTWSWGCVVAVPPIYGPGQARTMVKFASTKHLSSI